MTGTKVGLSRLSDEDLGLLLFIRRFEEALLDLFAAGQIAGTTHTCLGQEYIPVALAPLLPDDFVFSNHRGHGHYLAHCADPDGLLAEIMGRQGAVCRGVGGSQHLFREDRFLATGVQGESLPVAVGTALHFTRSGQSRIAVVYIGDGTWGEGVVYEALNLAQLWRVPLLVVVEHNGIAQSTPTHRGMAGSVRDRVAAFGIEFDEIDDMDVTVIRDRLRPRIAAVRDGRAPLVVQFNTVRLGPHSKGDDRRDDAELDRVRELDWCVRYARRHSDQFAAVDRVQRGRVGELARTVAARPPAVWTGR